jgi:diacylglycerol kinase
MRKSFLYGFLFAFRGLFILIKEERNARFHLFAAFCAMGLGVLLELKPLEWTVILMCIGTVFAAEALNSAVERLANKIHPEKDDLIKDAKDLAAAAVLVVSISSAVIGIIIYTPYFKEYLEI